MSSVRYLEGLVPDDALLHLPFDDDANHGDSVASISAAKGPDATLIGATNPTWEVLRNGRRGARFDGTSQELRSTGISSAARHIFVSASFVGAVFDTGYNGLLSTSSFGLFLGNTGTVDTWFDFGYGDTIRKDGSASNVGPMSGVPGLIEGELASGYTVDNIIIGEDRAQGRYWDGAIYGVVISPRVLTGYELANMRLWGHLVGRTSKAAGLTLDFPTPEQIFHYKNQGIDRYSRLEDLPEDFSKVDLAREYEDGGHSFYEISDVGTTGFEVAFNGISLAKRQVLDEFAREVRTTREFNFYNYRHQRTYKVRIARGGYRARHQRHRSWRHDCSFRLLTYPGD